jgi:hypothetical protein
MVPGFAFISYFITCGTGDQTQGLANAGQALSPSCSLEQHFNQLPLLFCPVLLVRILFFWGKGGEEGHWD